MISITIGKRNDVVLPFEVWAVEVNSLQRVPGSGSVLDLFDLACCQRQKPLATFTIIVYLLVDSVVGEALDFKPSRPWLKSNACERCKW